MSRLIKACVLIPLIEASLIVILLVLVTYRGMVGVSGTAVAIMHIAALFSAYAIIRTLASKAGAIVGPLFFAVCISTLTLEALIQQFTGLHLNWFVLSLLLESDSSQNIGTSLSVGLFVLAVIFALSYGLSIKYLNRKKYMPAWIVATVFVSTIVIGQAVYNVAFYEGRAEIMQAKRNLPFFIAPHPYYIRRIASALGATESITPFSDVQVERSTSRAKTQIDANLVGVTNKPNILFVITDSLRASELKRFPSLAPTLMARPVNSWLSLNHYSVSNCTHFSMFTMFTGRIATTFGQARRGGVAMGLINNLVAAGYEASTSESISLDWYDIEKVLLPKGTSRWQPPETITDQSDRDIAVRQNTIEQLTSWPDDNRPRVHITYFNGSHYPYGTDINEEGNSALERYHATIKAFDRHLAQILSTLEATRQLKQTLVIVTSDHGEELLADGRIGHASSLSELQIQVPLLVIGGNENTQNIRSHADIQPFVLNQLAPQKYPFDARNTLYLAGCDYDHPRDFRVLTEKGVYGFDYNDGYIAALEKSTPQSIKAAELLISTIQNGGLPAQE